MEDLVEYLCQTGVCKQQCICTVKNPRVHALASEKAHLRNMHPDVIAHIDTTHKINKHQRRKLMIPQPAKMAAGSGVVQSTTFFEQNKS